MFEKFSLAFPSVTNVKNTIDTRALINFVETELGVSVPREVIAFWEDIGAGYFGDKVLYVFGDESVKQPRDSFKDWNKKDFWQLVYPSPKDGGPVFFAETCFGDQLGFRWDGDQLIYILFCVDTFEAFAVAENGTELFEYLLSDRHALLDKQRFIAVHERLGPLQNGMHYAPIVSPMLGGQGDVENFCFETPNVHFRTAISNFVSIQQA